MIASPPPTARSFGRKTVLFIALLIFLYWLAPFAIVGPGTRGVLTTFGKVSDEVYGEGIHFVIPVIQHMHLMDVRIQKGEGQGDAASKDLQSVHTAVALNYHIQPEQVAVVFRELGQSVG